MDHHPTYLEKIEVTNNSKKDINPLVLIFELLKSEPVLVSVNVGQYNDFTEKSLSGEKQTHSHKY